MLRIIFLGIIVLAGFKFSEAQETKTQNDNKPKAYIFGEMKTANDLKVKKLFADFYKKLRENGELHGCIINYGSDRAVALREKQIQKANNFRYEDAPRITFIRGGITGPIKSVFWIVPKDAEDPTPN